VKKKEKRMVTAKGAKEREEESLFWNIVFCLYSLSWRHLAFFAVKKKEKRMVTAKGAKEREEESLFWNIVFCLYSLSWRHLAFFAVKKVFYVEVFHEL
jgi:hypothetical protein